MQQVILGQFLGKLHLPSEALQLNNGRIGQFFFSIFALVDILPKTDLDVWRKFVMACRILTTKCISFADISQFDRYIIDFCKGIERLYGSSVVTPNMHMHCHLSQCVSDYGPIYSFLAV